MHTLLVALCAAAATAGLVFNGYVLVVLLWQRRLHTAGHLLLLHLAIVDILFCFAILLMSTPLALTTDQLPPAFGQLQGLLFALFPPLMAWTISALSCDRYAAICAPFNYTQLVSVRRAATFLSVAWALQLLLALLPLFGICSYSYNGARSAFTLTCHPHDRLFALTYSACSMALPVSLIVTSSLHILVIARYQRHQIVSAIYDINNTLQATVAPTGRRDSRVITKRRGNALLVLLVTSYLILFTPTHVAFIFDTLSSTMNQPMVHNILVQVAAVLVTLLPALNAYVFGVKSRLIRREFKALFQRYLYQQQVSTLHVLLTKAF